MDEYLGKGSSKAACQIKAASAEKISKFGAVSICHNAVSYIRPTRIVPNEKLGYCCSCLPNLSKLSFVTLNCPTHLTSEIADIYIYCMLSLENVITWQYRRNHTPSIELPEASYPGPR